MSEQIPEFDQIWRRKRNAGGKTVTVTAVVNTYRGRVVEFRPNGPGRLSRKELANFLREFEYVGKWKELSS